MAEVAKTLTVAAVTLALIAMPAHAQMNAKRHQGDEKKTDRPEKKIDEKAYKAALERIPRFQGKIRPMGQHALCRARQETEIGRFLNLDLNLRTIATDQPVTLEVSACFVPSFTIH